MNPARWFFLLVLASVPLVAEEQRVEPTTGAPFRIESIHGSVLEVPAVPEDQITVLCFLGTECPLARLYATRLNDLAAEFRSLGVRFLGVNSNVQDSMQDVREFSESHKIEFAMGKDYQNVVADLYAVERTPEVVVVDRRLRIRYRGLIDDQYLPGISKSKPKFHYLRSSLSALLEGKEVATPRTEPVGCIIGRIKKPIVGSDVTYCADVAPVLQRHCVECHRDGEIGPFSLTEYDEVVGWAEMMLEVVEDGRMPPWHANPKHGEFKNSRRMPGSDKEILKKWAAAGAPFGDPTNLPKPLKFTDGWLLPQDPDRVISMRRQPFQVPAEGTVEYQYFVVDPGFEEDKWISAAQVIPGNRAVVHHSIVFIRPPDGARFRGVGWLAAYVPGNRSTALLPGHARFVPAGSKLVFQQHYTPNGSQQSDLTKIGILFADEENVTDEVMTLIGIDQDFEIQPNDANYVVKASLNALPAQGKLLSVMPHMHLRGKSFHLISKVESKPTTLLEVPRYDFNWQHKYEFASPISLDSIGELAFQMTFDNSANNVVNPDPQQHVTWGDQTWEEMAVAFFEVSEPRHDYTPKSETHPLTQREPAESPDGKADAIVEDFFKRFDENQDGIVEKTETPLSLKAFGFWRFDRNGDAQLSRDEILAAAKRKSN